MAQGHLALATSRMVTSPLPVAGCYCSALWRSMMVLPVFMIKDLVSLAGGAMMEGTASKTDTAVAEDVASVTGKAVARGVAFPVGRAMAERKLQVD